ncbi:MAG: PEP-CTERM sorting domain-containing protein [Leptolyngbya sp. SIOISBB]|nr:PEP-CTERM sorting domain-containing protein [Leptolyngbya sp. SIOISBB]
MLALSTLGTVAVVSPAQAFTVHQTSINDDQFEQLILDGEFSELFVAETRGGDGQPSVGIREIGINRPLFPDGNGGLVNPGPFPGAQGGLGIIDDMDRMFDFTLSYDAGTGAVNYTVGGTNISANVGNANANGIFLRTRAQGRNGGSATFNFSDLKLTDSSMSGDLDDLGSFSPSGVTDIDYLKVTDLTGSFTLTGKQTIDFTGSFPQNSRLAAQIKVGTFSDIESVPEPMTMLGTLVALAAGYSLKHRRSDQQA